MFPTSGSNTWCTDDDDNDDSSQNFQHLQDNPAFKQLDDLVIYNIMTYKDNSVGKIMSDKNINRYCSR